MFNPRLLNVKRMEVNKMLKLVKRLWKEEEGQGLAEYALILGLVAIVCVLVLQALGTGIGTKLDEVKESLDGTEVTPK